MLNIVTGVGPRVGSSFVMRQAKVAGLEVAGSKYLHGALPLEGNLGGYYDLTADEAIYLTQGVAKVWPVSLTLVRPTIDRMLILERQDKEAQAASIIKQAQREGTTADPKIVMEFCSDCLDRFLACERAPKNILRVNTEDLYNEIGDILNFLGD